MNQQTTLSGFDALIHSGIVNYPSKEDRNIKLSLDVYKGNASFTIFTGAGGSPWRQSLPPMCRALMLAALRKIRQQPHVCREPFSFIKSEQIDGKWNRTPLGIIAFGIDDSKTFYIELAFNELNNGQRFTFPVKLPGSIDVSGTSFTEGDILKAVIDSFIDALGEQVNLARRLSTVRQGNGGGGGNRGGSGGGNWNKGGSGGGNWNKGKSGGGNWNNNGGGGNGGSSNQGGGYSEDDGVNF